MKCNSVPSLFFMDSLVRLRSELQPDCYFQSQLYACPEVVLFSVPHFTVVVFLLVLTRIGECPAYHFGILSLQGRSEGSHFLTLSATLMDLRVGPGMRQRGFTLLLSRWRGLDLKLRAYMKVGDAIAWCQDLLRIAALQSSKGQRPQEWLNILAKTKKVCLGRQEDKPPMNVGKPSFTGLLFLCSEKNIEYK